MMDGTSFLFQSSQRTVFAGITFSVIYIYGYLEIMSLLPDAGCLSNIFFFRRMPSKMLWVPAFHAKSRGGGDREQKLTPYEKTMPVPVIRRNSTIFCPCLLCWISFLSRKNDSGEWEMYV